MGLKKWVFVMAFTTGLPASGFASTECEKAIDAFQNTIMNASLKWDLAVVAHRSAVLTGNQSLIGVAKTTSTRAGQTGGVKIEDERQNTITACKGAADCASALLTFRDEELKMAGAVDLLINALNDAVVLGGPELIEEATQTLDRVKAIHREIDGSARKSVVEACSK